MKVQCRYEENCIAQLCPMDETIADHLWYPDEDICRNNQFNKVRWVNRQRALRKHKRYADIGYFTKGMLEVLGRVTHKTKGVNPDNLSESPDKWIERYIRKNSPRVQNAVFEKTTSQLTKVLNKEVCPPETPYPTGQNYQGSLL